MDRFPFFLILLAAMAVPSPSAAAWLAFPTENPGLEKGQPEQFYMHVDREFEGVRSTPWEGGKFGHTRTPRRVGGGIVYTRFHEGIDIAPARRDASGEPLDPILAAAAGTVTHVSTDPGDSNYGIYVVIEHDLHGSKYYSLYAHLAEASVRVGQRVSQGERIGRLGYTGRGINKARAHLHFEFCMMGNRRFDAWFEQYFPTARNVHSIHNGMNLFGMDPIGLLEMVSRNPNATVPDFLRTQKPLFEITVRNPGTLDLLEMYPWLVEPGQPASPEAWTIVLSDSFVPLSARAGTIGTGTPSVRWLAGAGASPAHRSRGMVGGTAASPHLTDSGRRFAHLLTHPAHP